MLRSRIVENHHRLSQILSNFTLSIKELTLKRVCCIKISKKWTIKNQIIISLIALYSVSFIVILLVHSVNLILTKNFIFSEMEGFVAKQTYQMLNETTEQFLKSFTSGLITNYNIMKLISNAFLDQYEAADVFKERTGSDYCNPFNFNNWNPVRIGSDMGLEVGWKDKIDPYYLNSGKQVSYEFWSYSIYMQNPKDDFTKINQDQSTKHILNSARILNYIFKYYYFDLSVNGVTFMYIGFEKQKMLLLYPAMDYLHINSSEYDPTVRPWFISGKEIAIQNATKEPFYYISGPYFDYIIKVRAVTFVMPLITSKDEFLGVIGFDLELTQLENFVIDILKANHEVASFAYLFDSIGQVILGPSTIYDKIYLLNQTNITSYTILRNILYIIDLTNEHFEILKDKGNINQFTTILINNSVSYIVAKRIMPSYKKDLYYILAIFMKSEDIQSKSLEVNSIMFYTFFYMFLAEAFFVVVILFIVIIIASVYTKKVVNPLVQLTDYAKAINKNAHNRNATKNLKKLVKIDISQIKATGIIGELISTFMNLMKDLNINKRKTVGPVTGPTYQCSENLLFKTQLPWEEKISYLKDNT